MRPKPRAAISRAVPLDGPAPQQLAAPGATRARQEFVARHGGGWKVEWNEHSGTAHQLFGGVAFPSVKRGAPATPLAAEDLARAFLAENAELFGTAAADLSLVRARRVGPRWSVVFEQRHQGLRVIGGRAHAVLDATGGVLAAGSDCRRDVTLDAPAALSAEQAEAIAQEAIGFVAGRDRRAVDPELAILPVDDVEEQGGVRFRLVYRVTLEVAQPAGLWETLVDAASGEILERWNVLPRLDLTGEVRGDFGDLPAVCEAEQDRPAPHATLDFGALGSALTQSDGTFAISGATGPTGFETELEGAFVATTVCDPIPGAGLAVACQLASAADAVQTGSADPATPLALRWDTSNSRRDERTTYDWINAAHDTIAAVDPGLTAIDTPIPAAVGALPDPGTAFENFCPGNAYYHPMSERIYFCDAAEAAGTSFANLGELGDVVAHEWGHFLTHMLYGGLASPIASHIHEGNSDILAMFMTGRPELAFGYFDGACTTGIRNADNLLDIRFDWSIAPNSHYAGQILSGMTWDTWQALEASLGDPAAARATAMQLWHDGRALLLPGAGTPGGSADDQRDQVLGMFLADDDDANLANGTPHYAELCAGAARHGFEGPGPACPPFDPPFPAQALTLASWVHGSQLGDAQEYLTGVAAYVSPSGREYAVVGLSEAVGVVEVTDPANPVIVGSVPAPGPPFLPPSLFVLREIAVYDEYAYVVTESRPGVLVVDLTGVDSGLLQASTQHAGVSFLYLSGVEASAASGTLYAAGASSAGGGVQLFDLSDPANPALGVALTPTSTAADLDVRSVESGPHAGRELLVVTSAPGGIGSTGGPVWLIDVTDPANAVVESVLDTTADLGFAITHARLNRTGELLYVANRTDEALAPPAPARIGVYDVSDLTAPQFVTSFESTVATGAPDPDLEIVGDAALLVQGGAGLRVHDVADPFTAPEVGFLETNPTPGFRTGAYTLDSALPSRTLLVADVVRGLFVIDGSALLPPPACDNGLDDDGDGYADVPLDAGCASPADRDERGAPLACDDGLDNDGDGLADFPDDPGCAGPYADTEAPACDDDVDNDGDAGIDWDGGSGGGAPDPECVGTPWHDDELTDAPSCGLGFEVIPALLFLMYRTRREKEGS